MAFVTPVVAIAINLSLQVRVPPRKSGPLADWRAFGEVPYIFFALGFFLIYWAVYFAFYYVSIGTLTEISATKRESRLTDTGTPSRALHLPIPSTSCSPRMASEYPAESSPGSLRPAGAAR